jgi:hypothetical protein
MPFHKEPAFINLIPRTAGNYSPWLTTLAFFPWSVFGDLSQIVLRGTTVWAIDAYPAISICGEILFTGS